jgi:hypothetical protein
MSIDHHLEPGHFAVIFTGYDLAAPPQAATGRPFAGKACSKHTEGMTLVGDRAVELLVDEHCGNGLRRRGQLL